MRGYGGGGLKKDFLFLCCAGISVPVCLVYDSDRTAPTTHALVTRYVGDIDQYWGGGDIILYGLVLGRHSREGV